MPTNASGTGFWSAQQRNNARQGRALLQALMLGGSTSAPLSANRSGVFVTTSDGTQGYDLRVTVASGLTMTVQPGSAAMNRSGQGPYLGWLLPAAQTVTCDAAPATNPRRDIVVMRIYDAALGDVVPATGPCSIEIITGTPGAVPVDPVTWDALGTITSFPTTGGGVGIPLARAQVSTGGVITLTDIRRSTGLLGAVRASLPGDLLTDPSYMPGDIRWFNGLSVWDGAAWRTIGTVDGYARYERTTASAVQAAGTSVNTAVAWPNADTTDPGVTPGGASNLYFTLAKGTWEVHAGIRCSTTLNGTGELSLAWANGATTWSGANVKAIGGSGSGNVHVTATVVSDGTTAVSASLWQASGSSTNIQGTGSPFTHGTGISFSRKPN